MLNALCVFALHLASFVNSMLFNGELQTALQPLKCNVVQPHSSTFIHFKYNCVERFKYYIHIYNYVRFDCLAWYSTFDYTHIHSLSTNECVYVTANFERFSPPLFSFCRLIAIFAFDLRLLFQRYRFSLFIITPRALALSLYFVVVAVVVICCVVYLKRFRVCLDIIIATIIIAFFFIIIQKT